MSQRFLIIPRLPPGVGLGVATVFALLLLLNFLLLNEHVIHRYAAVFAVGRAMDKQRYVEEHPPAILILGNSRVDNGIDPRTLSQDWGSAMSAFNHGIPGANARVTYGMVKRLETAGVLDSARIRGVILGLDESFLQTDESLGYVYFFGHRPSLWAAGEYRYWLGSWARLWSYSDNLRELREPEKALRFVAATFQPLEPVGGAAWRYHGYRAGFGDGQNKGQIGRQETLAKYPPDPAMVRSFEDIIELFHKRGIPIAVTLPPLLDRPSAYLDSRQAGGAYNQLRNWLQQQPVTLLTATDPVPRSPDYFVNAGHLNDAGAQIYSHWLAEQLRSAWPWLNRNTTK